jgi:hypothetical protein
MNSFSDGAKKLFNVSIHILNQPIIKEGVKNIAGSVTFIFGLVEIYEIYQIIRGREISTETYSTIPKWVQVVIKVVIVCAKVSLILSAGVSSPGVFIISSLVGCIFHTSHLERVFGPNTIFAVNPWHPRHIISIVAVILALPSVIQLTYKGVNWMHKKICDYQNMPIKKASHWLTDSKIRLMALFNTISSRPALHIGNQVGKLLLGL